jgi:hypothetical protein
MSLKKNRHFIAFATSVNGQRVKFVKIQKISQFLKKILPFQSYRKPFNHSQAIRPPAQATPDVSGLRGCKI